MNDAEVKSRDLAEARMVIQGLVDRYVRNRDRYGDSSYNEETCRTEFTTSAYNLNRLSNIIARSGQTLGGLLGMLNSSFFNWLFSTRYFDYEIKPIYLRNCPMADVNDPDLVRSVTALVQHYQDLAGVRNPHERTALLRKSSSLEESLDAIVERLFELTPKERSLIDPYRHRGVDAESDESADVDAEDEE